MENDLKKLGMSFNRLAVRVLTVESALQALLSLLPETEATLWRERFQERLDNAMGEIEPNLNPGMDLHMTASMNALLDASRKPPTQS